LETSLPKFVDRGSASDDIIKVSFEVERKFNGQLATKIAEILLAHNPDDYQTKIFVYLVLTERYARSGDFDQALSIARQHQELVQDNALDQLIANESIIKVLLSLYQKWDECIEINNTSAHLVRHLEEYKETSMSDYQLTLLLGVACFAPYIADRPRENMYLRKVCKDIAERRLVENNEEFVRSYRQLQELKRQLPLNRPLRIGYLSGCLRRHSVGFLARWLLYHHDRTQFQIYGYILNYQKDDPLQDLITSNFHKTYGKVSPRHAHELASQISQDGIDILVDLDSLTSIISCQVLALRPAPIQVTWLGWDSSGQSSVDYFLADPHILPPDAEEYYPCKIWRLPQSFLAVDGFEVGIPTLRRDLLNIPESAVIYFTAQSSYKRNPHNVRLQMQILQRVPHSYLMIKGGGDRQALERFFQKIAEEEGISSDRLVFIPHTHTEMEHRANFAIADVVLDTYPYNGATHTMETLWMEVPIVTRVGEQFSARNSYSMMLNAGITEGIAYTDAEYVEWGVRLGTDPELRRQVVWKLKQGKQSAPLWNTRQFAREVESAYRQMWAKFQGRETPAPQIREFTPHDLAEASNRRGEDLLQAQDWKGAIEVLREAIHHQPDYAEAHYNLGLALAQAGDREGGIQEFQECIKHYPEFQPAHYNLGIIYGQLEQYDEAFTYLDRALQLNPNDVDSAFALGNHFLQKDELETAITYYRYGLTLNPDHVDCLCGLGAALSRQGKLELSQTYLKRAITLDPNHAQSHCNLGLVIDKQGYHLEAIVYLKQALELNPTIGQAYWQLCNILHKFHSFDQEAVEDWYQYAHNYYLYCRDKEFVRSALTFISTSMNLGLADNSILDRLAELEAYFYEHLAQLSIDELSSIYMILPYVVSHLRDDLHKNAQICRETGRLYVQKKMALVDSTRFISATSIHRPLRIGFLSAHFTRHPVAWCSIDVLTELAQITPHIYLYDSGNAKQTDLTDRFRQIAKGFYKQTTDGKGFVFQKELLIEQVRRDEIDILIDLDSLTETIHADIFVERPAPYLVSWLGFDAPFLDSHNYYLCDRYTHPDTTDAHYTEKLLKMPHAHMAIGEFPYQPVDRRALRQSIQVEDDQIVYLYPAHSRKFNPDTLEALMWILQFVPQGVLLIKSIGAMPALKITCQQQCEFYGIDPNRIKLIPITRSEEEYRGVYSVADVCLDSYPYNGGSQSAEALYFGLPLVTLVGQQPASRMGYAFLQAVGLDQGITHSWEEYVETAIEFGLDTDLRRSIQQHLWQARQPETLAPLWNPQKFAQDMYQILEKQVS
jgi:predicted O-linked N-acetylglucosamine transferase (SPINDLY family)